MIYMMMKQLKRNTDRNLKKYNGVLLGDLRVEDPCGIYRSFNFVF